jgi:hypothetical protein
MYGASYLQRGVSCCLGTVCGRDRALIFGRMADYMIRRVRDIGGQHQELRVDIHVDTGSEPPAVLQEIFECLESPVSERASELFPVRYTLSIYTMYLTENGCV